MKLPKKLTNPYIILSFSGLFAFFLYLSTMAPTVVFGDTGELITAAYFLGIPHPPGFPTWVLVAKLFTFIPISSIAWRVNLSSVLFTSVSIYMVSVLSYKLIKSYLVKNPEWIALSVSILVGLLIAVSPTFWNFATIAEVYGLFVLLSALLIFCVFNYSQTKESKWLFGISLLTGLILGTHYLGVPLIPILFLWIILSERAVLKKPTVLLGMTLSLLLGLSVFALLFIRASADIPIKWNHIQTSDDVVAHIQRKQFASEETKGDYIDTGVSLPIADFGSAGQIVHRGVETPIATLVGLVGGASPLLLLFGIAGIIMIWVRKSIQTPPYSGALSRQSRAGGNLYKSWIDLIVPQKIIDSFLMFCLLTLIIAGFGYTFATNNTIDEFLARDSFAEFSIVFLILAVLSSVSLSWIVSIISDRWSLWTARLAVIALTVIILLGLNSYDTFDRSHNRVAYDHAVNILEQVDQNAVVFADKNMWVFPLLYVQTVEQIRPDVTIYDRTDSVFDNLYDISNRAYPNRQALQEHRTQKEYELINQNPDRPYYLAVDKNVNPAAYPLPLVQEGVLYNVGQSAQDIDFSKEYQNIFEVLPAASHEEEQYMLVYYRVLFADYLYSTGKNKEAAKLLEEAETFVHNNYHAYALLGIYAMNREDYPKASELFEQGTKYGSYNPGAFYNYGLSLESQELYDRASTQYHNALELDPTYHNARLRLGVINISQNNCKNAERDFQQVPDQMVTTYEIMKSLADCWAQAGDTERAVHYQSVADQLSR